MSDAAQPDASSPDAADGGGAHFYPQVINAGGPRITRPRVVAVTFANGDATRRGNVDAFVNALGSSAYWAAATAEYGISAAAALTIHTPESAPASTTEVAIGKWLGDHVTSGDPAWADADGNTVFALYYPNTTKITGNDGGIVCSDYAAYHTLTNAGNVRVPFAIIPQCGSAVNADADTDSTAHELIEAVTDPFPMAGIPAYNRADDAHVAWQVAIGGPSTGELADMCVGTTDPGELNFRPPGLGALVPRIWSNQSIAAGHDPCVPVPAGEVYFNSWPILQDDITTSYRVASTVTTKGVRIPQGGSRTIDVRLISDGTASGPWTVEATEQKPYGAGYGLVFSWDRTTGANGDTLHLTISTPQAIPSSVYALFILRSTLGSSHHTSYGIVSN